MPELHFHIWHGPMPVDGPDYPHVEKHGHWAGSSIWLPRYGMSRDEALSWLREMTGDTFYWRECDKHCLGNRSMT